MRSLLLVFLLALTGPASADAFEFWPGARYDASVPTYEQVLGYSPGDRISSHSQALHYFQALAKARPEQLVIHEYAHSWEGRVLIYAAVGSPHRIAALDTLRQSMQALADPAGTTESRAQALIDETPGTVWLSYGVHGNEISSTDAAMLTAYHLLAAQDDPVVGNILANTVVFLDPMQNPDGRDRFVHGFEQARGLVPDPNRDAAEHDLDWPSGRVNHYTFDLNRDWLPLTQPETRGRVAALLEWFPLVFVDAHEMSGDSTYYFAPEAVPYNPHIHPTQRTSLELIGRNNARWFDRYGIDYFTREVFDAFYPGYGASWPLFYGAIATTYEQASVRGLVLRQSSGKHLHYRQAVRNHFVTSVSTAQVVAEHRQTLLRNFYDYRRSAIEAGERGRIREYLIDAAPDASAADKLAGLLVEHGVAVRRSAAGFQACGRDYPPGSYAVSLAQGAHRLIRTVLDPQVDMDSTFLSEQERKRIKDLPAEIYDVTAWSLPLMFNVSVEACNRPLQGELETVGQERIRPGSVDGEASVAYLVAWGTQAAGRFLAAALRDGLEVRSSDKAFTIGSRDYPAGSLIIKVPGNPSDLHQRLVRLARDSGARVDGVSDSWVDAGPNFGSENVFLVPPPRIALLWDVPAGTYSAGHTRFVLERQYGYPVTAIRGGRLVRADLDRFDVLILPEGGFWDSYDNVLGQRGAERISEWVRDGGTLVLLGSAVAWAADPEVNLVALRREDAWREDPQASDEDDDLPTVPGTRLDADAYRQAIEPLQEDPDDVPGALVRVQVDPDHWLANGVAERLHALVAGQEVYAPLRRDEGVNVARFEAADQLLASGYLWEENRLQLAYKPFVVSQRTGRGHVIAFTEDPNYRAYLDGLNVIFLNAVFRGPAHAWVVR